MTLFASHGSHSAKMLVLQVVAGNKADFVEWDIDHNLDQVAGAGIGDLIRGVGVAWCWRNSDCNDQVARRDIR